MNYFLSSLSVALGVLTAIILLSIYFGPHESSLFQYEGIEYDDLVTRHTGGSIFVTVENIPQRNCFEIDDSDFRLIPELKERMAEAKEYASTPDPSIEPQGVYTGYGFDIKNENALEIITKHKFNVTKTIGEEYFTKAHDPTYKFDCYFEYNGEQYWLVVNFETHYRGDGRYVFVNFTKDNNGIPIVENQNIVVYTGGFNSSVVFVNKLGHDITLINDGPDSADELLIQKDVMIPAGKMWFNYFRNWSIQGDVVYKYFIKPDNLFGTITEKQYPRCMTMEEAKSLYSQVGIHPQFPSYLPDGYQFQCGIHNLNTFLISTYTNQELRTKFPDGIYGGSQNGFLVNGGIRLDYYNDIFPWMKDPNYDKFESAERYGQGPYGNVTKINSNPAALTTEFIWYEGKGRPINNLWLFLDDSEGYHIQSGLSHDELVKIAESLPL